MSRYPQRCYRCALLATETWARIPYCEPCYSDVSTGRVAVVNPTRPTFYISPYTKEQG